MYRNIDVKTEMRKFTSSKPMHAVAGAGVLASQTLRDLPGMLVRWGTEKPVTSRATDYAQTAQARASSFAQAAQARANGYVQTAQARANDYVRSARAKANDGYDTLAVRGKKALNGQPARSTQSKSTQAHSGTGKSTQAHSGTAKSTQSKSGTAAQGKTASNGKPKGNATPRSTTGH